MPEFICDPSGVGCTFAMAIRRYRCAQPPATIWQAFGLLGRQPRLIFPEKVTPRRTRRLHRVAGISFWLNFRFTFPLPVSSAVKRHSANVNADHKSRHWEKLLWPVAAVILGALVSINPFYTPQFTLEVGLAVWVADLALVLICLKHPITGRLAMLVAGPCFAVPCFLQATPLARGVLMCGMALPFA